MNDPNLPEGVTQKDIDSTVGETFDPNLCEHENIVCENCEDNMDALVVQEKAKIKKLQARLENIKTLCGYLSGFHPPVCNGWNTHNHKIVFESFNCNCYFNDIMHEIEMAEDFI